MDQLVVWLCRRRARVVVTIALVASTIALGDDGFHVTTVPSGFARDLAVRTTDDGSGDEVLMDVREEEDQGLSTLF